MAARATSATGAAKAAPWRSSWAPLLISFLGGSSAALEPFAFISIGDVAGAFLLLASPSELELEERRRPLTKKYIQNIQTTLYNLLCLIYFNFIDTCECTFVES